MNQNQFETNAAIQAIETKTMHRVVQENGKPWRGGDPSRCLKVEFNARIARIITQSATCHAVHGGHVIRDFSNYCDVGFYGSCVSRLNRDEAGRAVPAQPIDDAIHFALFYEVNKSSTMAVEFVATQTKSLVRIDPEIFVSHSVGIRPIVGRWCAEKIEDDLFDSRDDLENWMKWVMNGAMYIDCEKEVHPNVIGRPASRTQSISTIVWSSARSRFENQKNLDSYHGILEAQRECDGVVRDFEKVMLDTAQETAQPHTTQPHRQRLR